MLIKFSNDQMQTIVGNLNQATHSLAATGDQNHFLEETFWFQWNDVLHHPLNKFLFSARQLSLLEEECGKVNLVQDDIQVTW